MGLVQEFKEFAVKGNAADMAVGIIIGAAFGKIVTSLVNDVVMPPIGVLIGGVDFTKLEIVLKKAQIDAVTNEVTKAAVSLRWGSFVSTVLDFLIVAWCLFMMVKLLNTFRRAAERVVPK